MLSFFRSAAAAVAVLACMLCAASVALGADNPLDDKAAAALGKADIKPSAKQCQCPDGGKCACGDKCDCDQFVSLVDPVKGGSTATGPRLVKTGEAPNGWAEPTPGKPATHLLHSDGTLTAIQPGYVDGKCDPAEAAKAVALYQATCSPTGCAFGTCGTTATVNGQNVHYGASIHYGAGACSSCGGGSCGTAGGCSSCGGGRAGFFRGRF